MDGSVVAAVGVLTKEILFLNYRIDGAIIQSLTSDVVSTLLASLLNHYSPCAPPISHFPIDVI